MNYRLVFNGNRYEDVYFCPLFESTVLHDVFLFQLVLHDTVTRVRLVSIIGSPDAETGDQHSAAHFLHADLDQDFRSLWKNESCPSLYLDKWSPTITGSPSKFKAMQDSTKFEDGHYKSSLSGANGLPPSQATDLLSSNDSAPFTSSPRTTITLSSPMSYIQNGYAEKVLYRVVRKPQGLQH